MDEWLWMCSLPGFYRKDLERLLQFFETPERIWRAQDSQDCHAAFSERKTERDPERVEQKETFANKE